MGHWSAISPRSRLQSYGGYLPTRCGVSLPTKVEWSRSAILLRGPCAPILTFVLLALYTGARFTTVRTLQWKRVNFRRRCLTWGKDKTPAGSGRTVPLNSVALAAMTQWAARYPNRKPDDYVFPAKDFDQEGKVFWNPQQPIGEVKEAWEGAKERAGIALGGEDAPPLVCRFHDLRHTAVTRMVEAGVPLPVIAKIVGWSASTLAKMVLRYSHVHVDTLREGMESMVSVGSHPFPHPSATNFPQPSGDAVGPQCEITA